MKMNKNKEAMKEFELANEMQKNSKDVNVKEWMEIRHFKDICQKKIIEKENEIKEGEKTAGMILRKSPYGSGVESMKEFSITEMSDTRDAAKIELEKNEAIRLLNCYAGKYKQYSNLKRWHLVSMDWFEKWKLYMGLSKPKNERCVSSASKTHGLSFFKPNKQYPGPISNDDLLLKDKMILHDLQGTPIKSELIENVHFIVIPEKLWRIWESVYGGRDILRISRIENNKIILDLYLKQVEILFLPEFDINIPKILYVDENIVAKEFIDKCKMIFTELNKDNKKEIEIRLWRTNEAPEDLAKKFNEQSGEIIVKGRIFDPTELIVENDKNNFVFIEVALQGAKFLGVPFFSQKIPRTRGDFSFARFKFNEILPSNVNMGITGIENLMNSCYMNSGIQCLSNCTELTKYFLLGFHNLDINKTNATGQNGELANAYAETIDALWKGHKQGIEPRELKSQVSRKAEQFGGYGQEDSGELIVFLLDGLHEDLNHAKRSDSVAAKEDDGEAQWDQYWNHNDSIIMELFLGQMKTQITCPQCNYKANKFETFITLSLPIPSFSYISIINVSEDFKLPATKKTIKVEHKMTMKSLNMNSEKKYLYTIIKGGRIAYRIHESISLLKVTDYTEEVYVFEYKPGEVGQECHLVEIQIEKSGVLCKRPMILRANLTWTLQKFKLEVFKKLLPFFKEIGRAHV